MAVTSIWPIKGRVDKVINYARNPEKTHDKERLSELHEIEGVVEYAADEMKTEKRAYLLQLDFRLRREGQDQGTGRCKGKVFRDAQRCCYRSEIIEENLKI